MFRAAFLSCLVFTTTLMTGCWEGVSRQVLATVLSAQGKIFYQTDEGGDLRPLTLQTNPGAGSTLRTGADGRANLALVAGVLVQISADSELKIEALRLRKDGNETDDGMRDRTARARLNRGSMSVVFQRQDASDLRFTIGTPNVAISADEDCVCRVSVQDGNSRVTVVRGKAYAWAGNPEPSIVKAGYFQDWPSGSMAIIADDPRGQSDVIDALEAERELLQLQAQQLNRLPF